MTNTRAYLSSAPVLITIGLLLATLGWDVSGWDLAAADWFGGPSGFPLRDHWLFSGVLHEGGRILSWLTVLWLCVSVWWPTGVLRRIDSSRRLQLAISALLAVLLVSGLKSFSATSCPWDLAAYGRTARYVSHWVWLPGGDGAGGHCFPAGHASAGFAFVGGYFAFKDQHPVIARRWWIVSMLIGFLLGAAQQVRGAHFMSHTLWTATLCWCTALAVDEFRRRQFGRNALRAD